MYLSTCWVPTVCQVFPAALFSVNLSTKSWGCDSVIKFSSSRAGTQAPIPALAIPMQPHPLFGDPFSPLALSSVTFYLNMIPVLFEIIFLWLLPIYPCFPHASVLIFSPVFYTSFFILLILCPSPSNHFSLHTGNPKSLHYGQYQVKIHRLSLLSIIPSFFL